MSQDKVLPKIIGIAGTNGSGKDTIGNILSTKNRFLFISVTDILRNDLLRRGLPTTRENTRGLSAEWRRQYGLGVLVDKAVAIYNEQADKYYGVAMASLRNPGEVDSIHSLNGIVIWIDADPKIRYQRVNEGNRGAHRSIVDNKTFGEFMADEAAEMYRAPDADEATLSMSDVKAKCDRFLINNGSNLETLKADLLTALNG